MNKPILGIISALVFLWGGSWLINALKETPYLFAAIMTIVYGVLGSVAYSISNSGGTEDESRRR